MRDFNTWLSHFRESISDYGYYVDFEKVHRNVASYKQELCILNVLINSKDIKKEFVDVVTKYPETLKCIPLLLAVRSNELYAMDSQGAFSYDFKKMNQSVEQYCYFMEETGLFDLLERHVINNLVDYATGVETGLDSNGRKNRGGHLMEDLVESFIVKAGFEKDVTYFKEIKVKEVEDKFGIDLSSLSNAGKTVKRLDFVLYANEVVYGIETNFYASSGSKLNETARSYKQLTQESANISGFEFVWFTDGKGWNSARNNLEETFDILEHLYSIDDLEQGILDTLKNR